MTDRDEFAKAAMQGALAGGADIEREMSFVTTQAWFYADAMIAARGKQEPTVPLKLVEEVARVFSVTPYGSGVLAAINAALDAGREDKQ